MKSNNKMFTNLSRIIKYGLLGFSRNGWLSAATIIVLFLAVTMLNGIIIFNVATGAALDYLKNKVDISVYFKTDTSEDNILNIQQNIQILPEVKNVNYISKDKALEIFKTRHSQEKVVAGALSILDDNPLLASLNIKAKNIKDYAVINDYLKTAPFNNLIEKISYTEESPVIDRLSKIINTMDQVGIVLTAILSFAAALIAFNTIRLAIHSYREEIGIMRLVGASNTFIQGPYVVEGIIYGALAALAGMIIFLPTAYYVSPYLNVFVPDLNLWNYALSNFFKLFFYQLIFSIGLSVISSMIAIKKYLKV